MEGSRACIQRSIRASIQKQFEFLTIIIHQRFSFQGQSEFWRFCVAQRLRRCGVQLPTPRQPSSLIFAVDSSLLSSIDPVYSSLSQKVVMSSSTESQGLPSAKPVELQPDVILQPPLSRCGQGPALILIRPSCYSDCQEQNKSLDPEPLQKWAEESFAVAQVTINPPDSGDPVAMRNMIWAAKNGLAALPECTNKEEYGIIGGFCRALCADPW